MNNYFYNKTIVILGGGTSGWISSLYLLNKSDELNLNIKVKLISSEKVGTIGVGEGTTPLFKEFIENDCKISPQEFLKETKGSIKYGVKFNNWNFDNDYYYHPFLSGDSFDNNKRSTENRDIAFIQYIINNNIEVCQKKLQRKLIGSSFDLLEGNKFSLSINNGYAYHFSGKLLIEFLQKKCLEFENFLHFDEEIKNISYDVEGSIDKVNLTCGNSICGDIFINCLGFNSGNLLSEEYFDNEFWDDYILNNSAFAIQVKNSPLEKIEPYTTSTAKEYGWCWKIPQYEKTGYGYVYSDKFVDDEDKLYNDILNTYNIKDKDVFKTKKVKSKTFYNRKQIHKNCISFGLSSGFIEPLEATSIHMTLVGLKMFFRLGNSVSNISEKNIKVFNSKMGGKWENVFKFILFHYFTNNPINEYWMHYKNIQSKRIFNFYEKYIESNQIDSPEIPCNNFVFSKFSYFLISLGMRMEDYYYDFSAQSYLEKNVCDYLKINHSIEIFNIPSIKEVLSEINNKGLYYNENYWN